MALASCFATAVEKRRPLPGDEMVSNPIFTSTHAVTIDAPREDVWPPISAFLLWVVMLGAVLWRAGTPQGEAS